MKKFKAFKKAFNVNEFGFVDLPHKISNVKISRIAYGDTRGCSFCFPHGNETTNSAASKNRRNWKNHRVNQWNEPH